MSYKVNSSLPDFLGVYSLPALIAIFMGPTWGPSGARQDPDGPHVGHMNLAIWEIIMEFI